MANTTTHLLAAGTDEATSPEFEVEVNSPVSLYLVPASGTLNVPGSAMIIIQRKSGTDWFNAEALNGATDPCGVLIGIGTFRAYRPPQSAAVGIDLVRGA